MAVDAGSTGKQLADFAKGLLGGTVEIGAALLPLIGAYAKSRGDPAWREKALKEWIMQDPRAVSILQRALEQVKDTLPPNTRNVLILALGGIPMPAEEA